MDIDTAIPSLIPEDTIFSDFLILDQSVKGRRLLFFNNTATTEKPLPVLLATRHYYEAINSNIHRGTHHLARTAPGTLILSILS